MRRLENKIILVAGAGGIGNALARRYAAEGAAVVLGDVNVDAAREVVAEIERTGGKAVATRLDGADEASVSGAVALACSTYGGLDGLHANFANFSDNGNDTGVVDLPLEIFDEVMRVNMRGFVLCTRAALPPILARGGGSVVYMSSMAGHRGAPTRVAYAMSKAAGNALMRHVAAKYGPQGVRANSIAPGLIRHESWGDVGTEFEAWARTLVPLKTKPFGAPEDIASLSALLMSDEGSFITGQVISVDGGATFRP